MSDSTTTNASFADHLLAHEREAYGVFAPATPEQLGLERAHARDVFALAWERHQDALAQLADTEAQLRAAARLTHGAGARVTQLAALLQLSRPTVYAILAEHAEGDQ